jgi:hypothetical protein
MYLIDIDGPAFDKDNAEIYITDDVNWYASRQKEILGLIGKGVFKVVDKEEVPEGIRIFKCRFVDEIKHAGTDKELRKSRLVV